MVMVIITGLMNPNASIILCATNRPDHDSVTGQQIGSLNGSQLPPLFSCPVFGCRLRRFMMSFLEALRGKQVSELTMEGLVPLFVRDAASVSLHCVPIKK